MANVNVMNELEVMNAAMQIGWVKFAYIKADGTKRVAIGTRNKALIERVLGHPLREHNSYYHHCNGYFDLSRVDWRQFNTSRFEGMIFDRLSNEQAVIDALSIVYVGNDYGLGDAVNARTHYTNLVSKDFIDKCMEKIVYTYNTYADASEQSEFDMVEKVSSVVSAKVSNCVPKAYYERTEPSQAHKPNRAELIDELMELRKRESEILAELLL